MRKGFLLGVDTCGDCVDLALDDGSRVRRKTKRADEVLWAALEALLKKAGRSLDALEGVVCATGPGRFTAVRVGVTFADMLARARGVPVVGLTRFAAFAPRLADGPDGLYGLVIAALREESYLQLWRKGGEEIVPAAEPVWVPAGGLEAALGGTVRWDAGAASASDLLGAGRILLTGRRLPVLRPLYLKPANYAK